MDKVINLEEMIIKRIENKAKEKFDVIKIEDVYMVNTNNICSNKLTGSCLDNKFFSDLKLVKKIRSLNLKEYDYIAIKCKKEKRNNIKVLELNIVTDNEDEDRVVNIKIKSDLSYEDKEELIRLIANENRDKVVFINFYEEHNFDSLKELISS